MQNASELKHIMDNGQLFVVSLLICQITDEEKEIRCEMAFEPRV